MKKFLNFLLLTACILLFSSNLFANNVVYNFNVAYKMVNFAGENKKAIAINNQIPGPILHFKEGDNVTIHVTNHLDVETAIHWHGLLVPWQMDGVLGVTQKGIQPGKTFTYKFKILQSGTYWYHSHAGLQEQLGLYGALIIDPINPPPFSYNKDFAIVISDWSNTFADKIYRNLKKSGDYYSPRFPLQSSLLKFLSDYNKGDSEEKKQLKMDYMAMQKMRMGIYDISDIAYNAFLLNGTTPKNPWTRYVNVGDVVRLRLIGAGANTIFNIKVPGTKLKVIHIDGNDIDPYIADFVEVAPGETYDVLVSIKKNQPYIIYAESIDMVGHAVGVLQTGNIAANTKNIKPFKEPKPTTRKMRIRMKKDHLMMTTEPKITKSVFSSKITPPVTVGTKYQDVKAFYKTNDPNKPIYKELNLELFGYMDRYIWMINGKPGYTAEPLILEPNKRYRFIFKNPSMMQHPMHIHGHWFILRNGHGSYDPLLHTINIPPGSVVTADLDTDASGQWFFHCHLLYHMFAGMSKVVQYQTLIELTKNEIKAENTIEKTPFKNRDIVRVDEVRPIPKSLVKHPDAHGNKFYFASYLDLGEDPFNDVQELTYLGMYGYDYNKLQLFINDAEIDQGEVTDADIDIFYWHLLNQFWAVKAGANYYYRPAQTPYWQPGIGLEGLFPYFIAMNARGYYKDGSFKADVELGRDTQITNNFFLGLGIRAIAGTKSVTSAQIGSGLNQTRYTVTPFYRLGPGISIFAEYEFQHNHGVFRSMQLIEGESATENTITFGLSFIL